MTIHAAAEATKLLIHRHKKRMLQRYVDGIAPKREVPSAPAGWSVIPVPYPGGRVQLFRSDFFTD
jgi:hypothetical protein